MNAKGCGVVSTFVVAAFFSVVAAAEPFSSGKLSFSVSFKKETSAYEVLAVSVRPDTTLAFSVTPANGDYDVRVGGAQLPSTSPGKWTWRSPSRPGLHPIVIENVGTGEKMTLNVFVLVPIERARKGSVNGYRIGDYFWAKPWDKPIYRPPPGLIEVTPEILRTRVSPHFRLRQFLCKQAGDYPKYVVLRERFLVKLELILEEVNRAGYRCDSFAILSGYRTPAYNKAIGNVKYSRHVWGGASDIYIDVSPADGMMDDLNGDGSIDVEDARLLFGVIDRMARGKGWEPFVGGMGLYKKTPQHTPFVHVDTRGSRTRWGD